MTSNKIIFMVFLFAMSGCAGVTRPIKFKETGLVTKESYLQKKSENGVVLLDVNWGRWWGCGGYENAQLVSLAFDKLPINSINNEVEASLVLHSPSRLMANPAFLNYAYSLEPGEYALSAFSIKVADSMSRVGFITANRDKLYANGAPVGGTFLVRPGETVFIGNFYLDCAYGPMLWRYYPNGKDAFKDQIKEYQNRFPFLELDDVKFHLFKTKDFGYDYELMP